MPKINELLRNHVTLEVECLDRIYLHGYIANLQIPGQWVAFLVQHRKQKIPSPALLNHMTQDFVRNVKQYFKENRALRTETTINNPKDFGSGLSAQSIERIVKPTVTKDGQPASGLKLGDPPVMALFIALTLFWHVVNGFRNADLRKHVTDLLDMDYKPAMMSYDLRRLLRKGIIYRIEHTNRYILTPYGFKVCRFFARLDARVFRPAFGSMCSTEIPLYPIPLPKALDSVDRDIDNLIEEALYFKDAA